MSRGQAVHSAVLLQTSGRRLHLLSPGSGGHQVWSRGQVSGWRVRQDINNTGGENTEDSKTGEERTEVISNTGEENTEGGESTENREGDHQGVSASVEETEHHL